MFTQLAPLIRERPVMLTILCQPGDAGEEIRLVITPQRVKDDDPPSKLENLAVVGTPEELDLELPEALASWVRDRKTIVDQVDEAKKVAAANAAAAAEAAKKTATTRTTKPTSKTVPPVATPQAATPNTVDDLVDAFGKDDSGKAEITAPSDDATKTTASGKLDLDDMPDTLGHIEPCASVETRHPVDLEQEEGGWE